MTVREEIIRLRDDYEHLTPVFRKEPRRWHCELQALTVHFGYRSIQNGDGRTKLESIVDARQRLDNVFAEERRIKALEDTRVAREIAARAAHAAREKALDDSVFGAI